MVFMDKLCINQKDDKMKEVGILGLGAFVQRSDKLLVLWSQRYFNRLWCAYEMGCFFSREEGQLEILPVKVAYILFLTAIFWHALMAALRFAAILLLQENRDEGSRPTLLLSLSAFCGPVTLVVLPLMNYLGMSIMRDVHQLPDQLQNFRLQDAQCFCCSHHHRHPETGQELICDRELVYQSLSELYSASQKESGVDPLEKFNRRVRDRLGPKILRRVGLRFPFKYVLFLIMVSNLASLPRVITNLVEGSGHQMSWSHRAIWSSLVFLQWFQRCLVMIFFLEISVRLWTLVKSRQRKVAWAIVLSPIQLLLFGCFWICLELPYVEENWVPFLVFLAALAGGFWICLELADNVGGSDSFLPWLVFLLALMLCMLLHLC